MRKIVGLIVLIVGSSVSLFAQFDYNAILPPSPTASSLGKYGDVPVSLYTGTPNISIPLGLVKGSELEIPISLSYMARGVKVEENASWVGTGWSLNCTGVITRTVRGLEDGTTRVHFPLSSTDIPTMNTILQSITDGQLDPEPDLYFFNFPGYSGSFVLDENGEAVIGDFKELRIKHDPVNFSVFTITTENGTQYIFDKGENTQLLSNGTHASTSAMYLSKIISPTGKEIIEFLYDTELTKYFSSARPKKWVRPGVTKVEPQPSVFGVTTINGLRLRKITTNFGQSVSFEPDTEIRRDLGIVDNSVAPRALKEVQFLDRHNSIKKRYKFDYETIETSIPYVQMAMGDPPADQNTQHANFRLYLKSVQEVAFDLSKSNPPHEFKYYGRDLKNKDLLPNRLSAAQDHWGYFNGATNIDLWPGYSGPFGQAYDWKFNLYFICGLFSVNETMFTVPGANREPNEFNMTHGTLSSITYPTGGKTTFEFEPHRYMHNDNVGGPVTKTIESGIQAYISGSSSQLEDNVGATVDAFPASHFSFEFTVTCWDPNTHEPLPCDHPDAKVNSEKFQGNSVALFNSDDEEVLAVKWLMGDGGFWIYRNGVADTDYGLLVPDPMTNKIEKQVDDEDIYLGDYTLKATKDPDCDTDVFGWFHFPKDVVIQDETEAPIGGGMRIKKIESFDEHNISVGLKTYGYGLGVLLDGPRYSTYTFLEQNGTPTWFQPCDYFRDEDQPYPYLEISCGSHTQLGYTQGSSIGYKTATEYHNGNGSIEYEYTTGIDYPDNNDNASNVISMLFWTGSPITNELSHHTITGKPAWPFITQDNLDRKRGFLKSVTQKNAAGMPILTTEYAPVMTDLKIVEGVRVLPLRPLVDWMYSQYKYSSGFVNIESSVERQSQLNSLPDLVKTTNFYYGSTNHKFVTKKEIFHSEGEIETTEYRYPEDYDNITDPEHVISKMKSDDLHITGSPIETRTFRNGNLIDGTISAFAKFTKPNGFFVAPKSSYKLYRGIPSLPSQWSADPTQPDNQHFSKEVELSFDATANLVKAVSRDQIETAFVWEPGIPAPIAKISNANDKEVFFSSFEVNGTLGDATNPARAGSRYLNQGFYNFSTDGNFNPTNPSELKMSYWYWSSGKWTFSGILNFQNSISSAGSRLEDVRVWPVGAQMTTFTYDPLLGMNSSTDVNNVTTYFEYDKFGRTEIIKDADLNIVKKYEYHYLVR